MLSASPCEADGALQAIIAAHRAASQKCSAAAQSKSQELSRAMAAATEEAPAGGLQDSETDRDSQRRSWKIPQIPNIVYSVLRKIHFARVPNTIDMLMFR